MTQSMAKKRGIIAMIASFVLMLGVFVGVMPLSASAATELTFKGATFNSSYYVDLADRWSTDGTTLVSGANTEYMGNQIVTSINTTGTYYYKVTMSADKAPIAGETFVFGIVPYRSTTTGASVSFHVKWHGTGYQSSTHTGIWEVAFEGYDGTNSAWNSWWFDNDTAGIGAIEATSTITFEAYRIFGTPDEFGLSINGTFVGSYSSTVPNGDIGKAGFYCHTRTDNPDGAGTSQVTATVTDFVTSEDATYKTQPTLSLTKDVPTTGKVGTAITLPGGTITGMFGKQTSITNSDIAVKDPSNADVTVTSRKFTPTKAGAYTVTYNCTDAWGATLTQDYTITIAEEGAATAVIKFNANGGEGTMADLPYTTNTAVTLTANSFTRAGYTFEGWATTKANATKGTVKYADGASVTLTTSSNQTLYAVWTEGGGGCGGQINGTLIGLGAFIGVAGIALTVKATKKKEN